MEAINDQEVQKDESAAHDAEARRELEIYSLELDAQRRDRLATYFLDLSKVSFGGLGLAALFAFASDQSKAPLFTAMLLGFFMAQASFYIGDYYLKTKNLMLCQLKSMQRQQS